jgi:hypothetical protein
VLEGSISNFFQLANQPAAVAGKPEAVVRLSLKQLKGLILAQNERWRRGLGMQVERVPRKGESGERDSNT